MTGPENYKEAERLLAYVTDGQGRIGEGSDVADSIAAAQVHATLALAAATALGLNPVPREYDTWQKTCGVKQS